jgi:hypothetical protein
MITARFLGVLISPFALGLLKPSNRSATNIGLIGSASPYSGFLLLRRYCKFTHFTARIPPCGSNLIVELH